MIIQIDGINTLNKGAELMLVAILEQLEKDCPGATIYLNPDATLDETILPAYNLNIKRRLGLRLGRYINGIAYRLKLSQPFNYFKENYAAKEVDILLDASGFKFSDQWDRSTNWLDVKERYYAQAKANGTKIFFLTQALGPFNTPNGKRSMQILSKYADMIFARDEISYGYAAEATSNAQNLKKSCDFTFKVKGVLPNQYAHIKDAIGIIPNKKMITHGGDASDKYLDLLLNIIQFFEDKGEVVFLLNHEGKGDFELCKSINSFRTKKLDIVSGLSAKEVKGVIGASKMIITSRFHGVASSLSQGVPCVATSWNHKYEMLFKDFGQTNCIVKAKDPIEVNMLIVEGIYTDIENVKKELKSRKPALVDQIDNMWKVIFEYYEQSRKN